MTSSNVPTPDLASTIQAWSSLPLKKLILSAINLKVANFRHFSPWRKFRPGHSRLLVCPQFGIFLSISVSSNMFICSSGIGQGLWICVQAIWKGKKSLKAWYTIYIIGCFLLCPGLLINTQSPPFLNHHDWSWLESSIEVQIWSPGVSSGSVFDATWWIPTHTHHWPCSILALINENSA